MSSMIFRQLGIRPSAPRESLRALGRSLALALLLALGERPAAAAEDEPPVAAGSLTAALVQERLEAAQESAELSPALRDRLVDVYRQTLTRLREAEANTERAATFLSSSSSRVRSWWPTACSRTSTTCPIRTARS